MKQRYVSLKTCTTIREHVGERVDIAARSQSRVRRRRLHTGALRWVRDVCADGRPVQRVLLVALTMKDTDPALAKGAIEQLFERLKDRGNTRSRRSTSWSALPALPGVAPRLKHEGVAAAVLEEELAVRVNGRAVGGHAPLPVTNRAADDVLGLVPSRRPGHGSDPLAQGPRQRAAKRAAAHDQDDRMRYLWWAEFQKRGALHYHAVLVDPPFELLRDARKWFDAHWRSVSGTELAGIQTYVEWRSGRWFRDHAGDYVLKDVRKISGKHYEQDYARMPRGWRTFRSHQLTFTAAEHKQHETSVSTVCTAKEGASFAERSLEIWIDRRDVHVPARDGCRLSNRRQRRGRQKATSRDNVSPSFRILERFCPFPKKSEIGGASAGGQATASTADDARVALTRDPLKGQHGACSEVTLCRNLTRSAVELAAPERALHRRSRQMAHSDASNG